MDGRLLNGAGASVTLLLDDAEAQRLVRAAQQYDDHALARIYQVYADRIFRYAYYRLGDRNRAEELTGEVFVRLLENIRSFRLGTKGHTLALTGWIYRIAHNLIIDEYRRRHRRPEEELSADDGEASPELDGPIDISLTRADLQLAIQQLTDDQQQVILLRFEAGFASAEIAQMMGRTETAVKALQRRGLAALARLLAPQEAVA